MLETKIKKIITFWALFLGLGLLLIILASSVGNNGAAILTTASAEQPAPQVLGATIDLRGELPPQAAAPSLLSPFDDAGITAKSFLVADFASDSVIAEKNSDQKEYVASLTKLMTGLVAYENSDINSLVTTTSNDIFSISPVLGLRVGDSIKLLDLFNAMLVGSNNDAALALSNHVENLSGKNFVDSMNSLAGDLGMTSSHFSNPLGFDSPGNYSTAGDLLKLVLATQKFSAFTQLGKKTEYDFVSTAGNQYRTKATDKLIAGHGEIEAVKTGYTQGAGQAMITKATQDGHTIIIIVLDSQDREGDTLNLEKQIFKNTKWQ